MKRFAAILILIVLITTLAIAFEPKVWTLEEIYKGTEYSDDSCVNDLNKLLVHDKIVATDPTRCFNELGTSPFISRSFLHQAGFKKIKDNVELIKNDKTGEYCLFSSEDSKIVPVSEAIIDQVNFMSEVYSRVSQTSNIFYELFRDFVNEYNRVNPKGLLSNFDERLNVKYSKAFNNIKSSAKKDILYQRHLELLDSIHVEHFELLYLFLDMCKPNPNDILREFKCSKITNTLKNNFDIGNLFIDNIAFMQSPVFSEVFSDGDSLKFYWKPILNFNKFVNFLNQFPNSDVVLSKLNLDSKRNRLIDLGFDHSDISELQYIRNLNYAVERGFILSLFGYALGTIVDVNNPEYVVDQPVLTRISLGKSSGDKCVFPSLDETANKLKDQSSCKFLADQLKTEKSTKQIAEINNPYLKEVVKVVETKTDKIDIDSYNVFVEDQIRKNCVVDNLSFESKKSLNYISKLSAFQNLFRQFGVSKDSNFYFSKVYIPKNPLNLKELLNIKDDTTILFSIESRSNNLDFRVLEKKVDFGEVTKTLALDPSYSFFVTTNNLDEITAGRFSDGVTKIAHIPKDFGFMVSGGFQANSPVTTVAGVRGTNFVYDGSTLKVLEGEVSVLDKDGNENILTSNMAYDLSTGTKETFELTPAEIAAALENEVQRLESDPEIQKELIEEMAVELESMNLPSTEPITAELIMAAVSNDEDSSNLKALDEINNIEVTDIKLDTDTVSVEEPNVAIEEVTSEPNTETDVSQSDSTTVQENVINTDLNNKDVTENKIIADSNTEVEKMKELEFQQKKLNEANRNFAVFVLLIFGTILYLYKKRY